MLLLLFAALFLVSGYETPEGGYLQPLWSFKTPYIRGEYETDIAFWKVTGATVIGDNFISLTPDEKSRTGQMWAKQPTAHPNWEVQLRFVIGKQGGIGADGMAFWFTKEMGVDGTALGSSARYEGLGIFFDTFDNGGRGSYPRVTAMMGDGEKEVEFRSNINAGACQSVSFRRADYDAHMSYKHPTIIAIRYENGVLSLKYDLNNMYDPHPHWQHCFEAHVALPVGYYYGISAATGGLSDHHDIVSFQTFSLHNNVPQNNNNFNEPARDQPRQATFEPDFENPVTQQQAPPTGDPAKVGTYIQEAHTRQAKFGQSLEAAFNSLAQKLNQVDKITTDALSTVTGSIAQMSTKLNAGKVSIDTLKQDLAKLTRVIETLAATIDSVETLGQAVVEATKSQEHANTKRKESYNQAFDSSSLGFWIFFILFQLFFLSSLLFWRKTAPKKRFP